MDRSVNIDSTLSPLQTPEAVWWQQFDDRELEASSAARLPRISTCEARTTE